MNRQTFEILKIVKNSHQNTRGILFLVILTLFFPYFSFYLYYQNSVCSLCSTLRDLSETVFASMLNLQKVITFIFAEKKVSENRI